MTNVIRYKCNYLCILAYARLEKRFMIKVNIVKIKYQPIGNVITHSSKLKQPFYGWSPFIRKP